MDNDKKKTLCLNAITSKKFRQLQLTSWYCFVTHLNYLRDGKLKTFAITFLYCQSTKTTYIDTDEIPGFLILLILSFTCKDVIVAMVTNTITLLWESFQIRCVAGSCEISLNIFLFLFTILTFWNKNITIMVFISPLWLYIRVSWHFCHRHFTIGDYFYRTILLLWKWIRKCWTLYGNFISINRINRTSHGHLGIWILYFCAVSIFHQQGQWLWTC